MFFLASHRLELQRPQIFLRVSMGHGFGEDSSSESTQEFACPNALFGSVRASHADTSKFNIKSVLFYLTSHSEE